MVDAGEETFDFLGFTYRRVWNRRKDKRATLYYPAKKAQKRLREQVRQVLSPMAPVRMAERVERVNEILRGWVNYFRVSNAHLVFRKARWYVELKLRRLLQRQAHRRGRGWKRYSSSFLHHRLGLYQDYRVLWERVLT